MNTVQLVGRLVRDPDIKYANNGTTVTHFTVAADRRTKDGGADFITCVAFNKTAEFIEKYFVKGQRIGLTGHIHTDSYTNKNNEKVYTTDVVADSVEFVDSKKTTDTVHARQRPDADGFINVPEGVEAEGLPFN